MLAQTAETLSVACHVGGMLAPFVVVTTANQPTGSPDETTGALVRRTGVPAKYTSTWAPPESATLPVGQLTVSDGIVPVSTTLSVTTSTPVTPAGPAGPCGP